MVVFHRNCQAVLLACKRFEMRGCWYCGYFNMAAVIFVPTFFIYAH